MIRQASAGDTGMVAALACRLWPEHTQEEMEAEFASAAADAAGAVFLYFEESTPVGFAQCQLRADYVEGTHGGPVGYLEGIYVEPGYRRRGIAKALLAACEQWAREQGCAEFASDCELENAESLAFHLHAGFAEVNRIICFAKKLERLP